ncbi:MAPEG family protein [Ectothiorhodospiraceae bacterium WFHF3C12]|nr:MAPEG family protein [Ectothiorhodospiraceae bacterium WFHF3C12]
MSTELFYLVLVTALTGVLWIPYILNRIAVRGLIDAVGYPADPKPHAPWAQRLIKAHTNAVENLVVFAPLVLAAEMAGATSGVTAGAAAIFFWARLVHAVSFAFAIPWVRTLAFAVGFFCQAAIAWVLLIG